jgi:hypothetical protein
MAERMSAEYVELANTQYCGWAWLGRARAAAEPRGASQRRGCHAVRRLPAAADHSVAREQPLVFRDYRAR